MLQGYHANAKLRLDKGVQYLVFSKEADFERYFGKSFEKDKPRFEFEHVVVMLTAPTKEQYFLSFESEAYKAGGTIEVYCTVRKEPHLLTYNDHPIAIAAIPKYFAVHTIKFYSTAKKRKLLRTIAVSPR